MSAPVRQPFGRVTDPRFGTQTFRKGVEFDADRETALQLRDQIRRLRHVEGACRDKKNVVGANRTVLCLHGRALDDVATGVALDNSSNTRSRCRFYEDAL